MPFEYDAKLQCEECGRWIVVAVDHIAECDVCAVRYIVEVEQVEEGDE